MFRKLLSWISIHFAWIPYTKRHNQYAFLIYKHTPLTRPHVAIAGNFVALEVFANVEHIVRFDATMCTGGLLRQHAAADERVEGSLELRITDRGHLGDVLVRDGRTSVEQQHDYRGEHGHVQVDRAAVEHAGHLGRAQLRHEHDGAAVAVQLRVGVVEQRELRDDGLRQRALGRLVEQRPIVDVQLAQTEADAAAVSRAVVHGHQCRRSVQIVDHAAQLARAPRTALRGQQVQHVPFPSVHRPRVQQQPPGHVVPVVFLERVFLGPVQVPEHVDHVVHLRVRAVRLQQVIDVMRQVLGHTVVQVPQAFQTRGDRVLDTPVAAERVLQAHVHGVFQLDQPDHVVHVRGQIAVLGGREQFYRFDHYLHAVVEPRQQVEHRGDRVRTAVGHHGPQPGVGFHDELRLGRDQLGDHVPGHGDGRLLVTVRECSIRLRIDDFGHHVHVVDHRRPHGSDKVQVPVQVVEQLVLHVRPEELAVTFADGQNQLTARLRVVARVAQPAGVDRLDDRVRQSA